MHDTPASRLPRSAISTTLRGTALLAALCAIAVATPAFAAEGGLRVGVQGTLSQSEMDIDVPVLRTTGSLDAAAPGAGVLAQYIFGVDEQAEDGLFFGLEAGFAAETFSETRTFRVSDVPATVASEATWSADLLWLVGYDFGKLSAFASTGVTFAGNEIEAAALGLRGGDKNKHVGWKLGPGVAVDLGRSSVIARASYTMFKPKNYTDRGLTLEIQPKRLDVSVAWVYKLDDVLFWRR